MVNFLPYGQFLTGYLNKNAKFEIDVEICLFFGANLSKRKLISKGVIMSKVLQVVIYKSVSDEEKLAAYAKLALPAMEKAGAKFLARGVPIAVREEGQKTRTVVIEWPSMEAADKGYNGLEYQAALKALDGSASREFRYVETI